MSRTSSKDKGVSLAKGPVALLGLVMIAYGVIAFILGGNGFTMHPVSGMVSGDKFLGIEGNGWTNLLWVAGGLLLAFGSRFHWTAKGISLIVGLAMGAASVIALVDGTDVFGIFAANGPTKLAWGVVAIVLLALSLLPRVGGGRKERTVQDDAPRRTVVEQPVAERDGRFTRQPEPARDEVLHGERRVVAPADGDGVEDRPGRRL